MKKHGVVMTCIVMLCAHFILLKAYTTMLVNSFLKFGKEPP